MLSVQLLVPLTWQQDLEEWLPLARLMIELYIIYL